MLDTISEITILAGATDHAGLAIPPGVMLVMTLVWAVELLEFAEKKIARVYALCCTLLTKLRRN